MSSNVRAVQNSTEGLRSAAHDIANILCTSDVGGECYHGGRHTCFTRQGRKPLPLYKVEEMCERCAASWHAVMAAALLDSVVIGQQFLGASDKDYALHIETNGESNGANGVAVHGKKLRATGRPKAGKKPKVTAATVPGVNSVSPHPTGKYSAEDREELVKFYQTLPRSQKAAFNERYNVKAWQMRDWAK